MLAHQVVSRAAPHLAKYVYIITYYICQNVKTILNNIKLLLIFFASLSQICIVNRTYVARCFEEACNTITQRTALHYLLILDKYQIFCQIFPFQDYILRYAKNLSRVTRYENIILTGKNVKYFYLCGGLYCTVNISGPTSPSSTPDRLMTDLPYFVGTQHPTNPPPPTVWP